MRLIVGAVLSLLALVVHAGYYIVITNSTTNDYGPYYQGWKSDCYMFASTAIGTLADDYSNKGWLVETLTSDGQWKAKVNATWSNREFSGRYFSCNAQPNAGVMPAFVSGVSDPSFTSGTSVGGASSAGDIEALRATINTLQTTIATQQATLTVLTNANAETFDIAKAWAAFSFFFGSILLLWSVAKGGGVVLSAIRRKYSDWV